MGRCGTCGAEVAGAVCRFCGVSARPLRSLEDEHEAILEFHEIARTIREAEHRERFFKGGHVPTHLAALVEAGLQCLPLIEDEKVEDRPVVQRLEAITARLRVQGHADAAAQRAIAEFEGRIARYEKADTRLGWTVAGVILVVLALVAGGVWLVVR